MVFPTERFGALNEPLAGVRLACSPPCPCLLGRRHPGPRHASQCGWL